MIALYAVARALELGDRALGGGHAWKHLAAAAAMACYSSMSPDAAHAVRLTTLARHPYHEISLGIL